MKVLHLYKSYYPESVGGVEKFIDSLASQTQAYGVDNILVTTAKANQYFSKQINAVKVHFFPETIALASCPMSLLLLKNFKKLVDSIDIIHMHFPWPFADVALLRIKKRLIITYHSDIVRQRYLNILYKPLMHSLLKKANKIIATSQNYIETSPVLKNYKDKCIAIPIGLDDNSTTHTRQQNIEPFFLFVGVLRYYKGLDYLIEAVKDTPIKIVIAGKGPEEQHLKNLVEKYKMSNVSFVGLVSEEEKIALYQSCRAVVIPSHLRSEAFCITLVEGLMHGKPLISTELGTGSSFVNQDKQTGFVIPPEDPDALKNAMQVLLNNEELCCVFGMAARDRYQQLFTSKSMADAYMDCYRV